MRSFTSLAILALLSVSLLAEDPFLGED